MSSACGRRDVVLVGVDDQAARHDRGGAAIAELPKGAEWEAFTNWVKQNPKTAERLMLMVEEEQIDDPEHRSWIAERRLTEGPNVLTDLPRLFEWLKAQRNLKKLGLDPDPPPPRE